MSEKDGKIIVSACLAGIPCRYDGKAQRNERIAELVKCGKAIAVCPECMSGLTTPRIPAEIVGGSGEDVLDKKAQVIASNGEIRTDVTEAFISGAEFALKIAKENGAVKALLKSNSPSCGCGTVYDGTFSGGKKKGNGVTAALFIRNGIEVQPV